MPSLGKSEDLTTLRWYSHTVNLNYVCALPFTIIAHSPHPLSYTQPALSDPHRDLNL